MTDRPQHWIAKPEAAPEPSGWTRHLAALAEVIFAGDSGAPPASRIAWTVEQVRQFCREVGGKSVLVFRLALFGVSWVAPLLSGAIPPLRRHGIKRRETIVHRFEASIFGLSIFAVKAFLCMHYFEHPDVADEVNFDGEIQ
jgi:hypothetical protein